MEYPCECWDGGTGGGNASGAAYCGICGSKYNYRHDKYADETISEHVVRKLKEKIASERVVNTRVKKCDKPECAWFRTTREGNCFRDLGDCRYIVDQN